MSPTIPSAITSNKLSIGFFAVLLSLLWFLTRPGHLRLSAFIATGIGIFALMLSRQGKAQLLRELLRDIGIAFIVAVVVTVVYEFSTRNVEHHQSQISFIDKAMEEFVPKNVWGEVKEEILYRHRIRRNVEIEFKIMHRTQLSNGRYIAAPPGQVLLWMKYKYDLYTMTAGAANVPVEHQLAYEMWNKELEVPRFESVSVISHAGRQVRHYVREDLKKIDDGKGSIRLDGPDIVYLPAASARQPVQIVTERYELLNVPGSYNLLMPELTARLEESQDPTIKVSITELPWDADVELNTYYAGHAFTQPDKKQNVWIYDKIVLPGQGFTLIVRPKFPPTNDPTTSPSK